MSQETLDQIIARFPKPQRVEIEKEIEKLRAAAALTMREIDDMLAAMRACQDINVKKGQAYAQFIAWRRYRKRYLSRGIAQARRRRGKRA